MSILYFVGSLILLLAAAGYYLFRIAFYPKRHSRETTTQMELDAGKIASFDIFNSWPRQEIAIQSPYGYTLRGYYFPVAGSNKTVIFSHGITITLMGSAKYMPVFRQRGFNILVYDNRFHGLSGGSECTFGYYEKIDLKALVDWALTQVGPNGLVGTHGESLGAAITLQHAAIDPRVAFSIADCGFTSVLDQFQLRLRSDYHLPSFPLLQIARLYARAFFGFDYYECSPLRAAASIKAPVLIVHGAEDKFVPTWMGEAIFAAKTSGPRRLYIVPGAAHAYAYSTDPAEYDRQVIAFLDDFQIDTNCPSPEATAV